MKKYGKGLGSGWHYCSHEHSLASRGIKTKRNIDYSRLDLKRYSGKWYQVSANPAWFQSGCKDSRAEYKQKGDVVEVRNTCTKGGRRSVAVGSAKVVGDRSLAVSFAPFGIDNPFDSPNYKILYTDYDVSVVGSPDKKYLWILSRKKNISDVRYRSLVGIAKKKGYDVSGLVKTLR